MKGIKYSISQDVFDLCPEFIRGVVVVENAQNGPSPAVLVARLRAAEEGMRSTLTTETLLDDVRIAAWRDSFRAMGVKPTKYRPSMEAMARRIVRGGTLPTINKAVDAGNIVSVERIVPIGCHALDEVLEPLELRRASGSEIFVPFGSDQPEQPEPGEIIFAEGNKVLTRRWCWRQATHTSTLPTSRRIAINVDALPPVTFEDVKEICLQLINLVKTLCGGQHVYGFMTRDFPVLRLGPVSTGSEVLHSRYQPIPLAAHRDTQ